jgi:topoisomerase-4 subunit A
VPGPDFPTGGVIVERAAAIQEAYETGRGSIRVRARYTVEDLGRGMWQVVVTEIPYQVQKGKLIEDLAGLIEAKKAPLLADVRDESAEDLRIVLEPKSRTVEPEHLMESLFRLSALENRFSVNMNVLDATGAPRVMGLKACLTAFLDHRREVLVRRARYRLEKIERRLHLLDGLLIAFLNLDEVIRIVREAEHPKAELIARFGLSEMQADYILDTRLRNLARLEEMSLKREHGELMEERAGIAELLDSDRKQWKLVGTGLKDVRKQLAAGDAGQAERPSGVLGRSSFGEAAETAAAAPVEAFIVREAITVVLSERGWIRAAKGKVEDPSELKFKEGDRLAWLVPAETTDKLLIFASDGRAFTPGLRQAAERARARRAAQADAGSGGGCRADRGDGASAGPQAGDGFGGRLRLHPPRGRGPVGPARRQAGDERRGPGLYPGGRRPCGGAGQGRQGADLPAG